MPAVGINLNKSDLPPWLEALYREVSRMASNQAATPYMPYQGSRLEDFNADQQKAFGLGRNYGLHTTPLKQAEEQIWQGSRDFPSLYEKYMNPYTQQVVKGIGESGNKNFIENILPAIESQFVSKGQVFSGHHQQLANKAGLDAQQQITRQQNEALARGYEHGAQTFGQDQSRHLLGAEAYSNLGKARQAGNLADITMLQDQGKQQQLLNQQSKDIGYQDFLRKQNHPQQQIANYSATLHGIPAPVTQTQYLQTPGTPQVNTSGNLGSLAGQLYGMNKMGGYAEGGRVEDDRGSDHQGWNEEDLLMLLAFLQGEGTSSQRHPSEKSDRRSEPQHDIRTLIEHCFT